MFSLIYPAVRKASSKSCQVLITDGIPGWYPKSLFRMSIWSDFLYLLSFIAFKLILPHDHCNWSDNFSIDLQYAIRIVQSDTDYTVQREKDLRNNYKVQLLIITKVINADLLTLCSNDHLHFNINAVEWLVWICSRWCHCSLWSIRDKCHIGWKESSFWILRESSVVEPHRACC